MSEEKKVVLKRDAIVIFNLRNKVRVGKVITKGSRFIGLEVLEMLCNTKISTSTNLVPLTVFVEKELLDKLQTEE